MNLLNLSSLYLVAYLVYLIAVRVTEVLPWILKSIHIKSLSIRSVTIFCKFLARTGSVFFLTVQQETFWSSESGTRRAVRSIALKKIKSIWCIYKVVQIWPGLFVCKQVTVCSGHIWTTLYMQAPDHVCVRARARVLNWWLWACNCSSFYPKPSLLAVVVRGTYILMMRLLPGLL